MTRAESGSATDPSTDAPGRLIQTPDQPTPLTPTRDEPVLPIVTRDEVAEGWGDGAPSTDDDWYLRERPPHHEG